MEEKIKNVIEKYPNQSLKNSNNELLCEFCNVKLIIKRKFLIEQHINTKKHKSLTSNIEDGGNCSQMENTSQKEFFENMCEAILAADIPFWKLQNEKFTLFLEQYMNRKIPDESTLRKNYLKKSV